VCEGTAGAEGDSVKGYTWTGCSKSSKKRALSDRGGGGKLIKEKRACRRKVSGVLSARGKKMKKNPGKDCNRGDCVQKKSSARLGKNQKRKNRKRARKGSGSFG